jgi:glycosyltransferase involved in cell wall biosynthesis
MRPVIVYRDHILPRSEVAFMQRQYLGFDRLEPVWIGRRVTADYVPGSLALGPIFTGARGALFKALGMVPDLAGLRALNVACVHAQFGRGGALALPLAKALGVPLAVTFHGGDAHKSAHWSRFSLQRQRMRGMIEYASAFVCVSEGVRLKLVERGVPPSKLLVHPIGVEIPPLRPRANAGEGLLFIGRFVEMKGLPVLIDAVKLLRARGNQANLVVIGDGPDRPSIEAALAGVTNVELRGWQTQEHISDAITAARVVVIPSVIARSGETEGLPSVAMEAMRMATPVVASSDASTLGLIRPGENGLVVPSRQPAALADAIEHLLTDPDTAMALGAAGRLTVEQDFNAEIQSRGLQDLLLNAAQPRSR